MSQPIQGTEVSGSGGQVQSQGTILVSSGDNGVVLPTPTYSAGHVKRDPVTGEVAIRTGFDDSSPELANLAWLGATVSGGPRHHTTAEVTNWQDLYFPQAVVLPPLDTPLITNPQLPDAGATA